MWALSGGKRLSAYSIISRKLQVASPTKGTPSLSGHSPGLDMIRFLETCIQSCTPSPKNKNVLCSSSLSKI
jgi:hypothetical protein